MSEHTPGPWHWWSDRDDDQRPKNYPMAKLLDKDGRMIFCVHGGAGEKALGESQENIANARLIAAAPQLLAACKDYFVGIEEGKRIHDDFPPGSAGAEEIWLEYSHEQESRYVALRAAVAAAEQKGE